MFQEYPKGLFKDGDPEGDFRIVHDLAQESEQRESGFISICESKEKPVEIKRRGRPPRVTE